MIANGSNSPEQGIDCDFDSNLRITGGTVFSIGGIVRGKPNVPRNKFSTQQAVAWSGIELQRDKYINLCDDKGNVILSYKLPRSIARAGVVISSPQLKKEGTYTLSTSDTPASGTHIGNGLFADGKCTAAEDAKSFTIESLITKIDAEGNTEAIAADTIDIGKEMMMPPPPFAKGEGGPGMPPPDFKPGMAPPFDINNIPDSIKKRFPFPADGKMPFPPPSFNGMRGKDEGYNVNNLPGGGW